MRTQKTRGNVFVANLPPELTEDQLAEAFDPYGIVLSASIARDPESGRRLRYGFVDIATERAAKLAVEALNGTALDGHNLDVRISVRPAKAKKPGGPRPTGRRQTVTRYSAAGPGGLHPAATRRPAPDDGETETDEAAYSPRPGPRRQPSFVVERRPLPRRI